MPLRLAIDKIRPTTSFLFVRKSLRQAVALGLNAEQMRLQKTIIPSKLALLFDAE